MSRSGNYIVVSRMTQMLPDWCIKCGKPGTKALRQTYSWHPPALYLLLFLSPIVYAIFASPFLRKMTLKVTLCPQHASRRRTLLFLATVLLLGSIPLGIALGMKYGLIPAVLGFLAGLVLLIVGKTTLRAIKVTETDATYTGLGEGFLRQVK